MVDNTPKILPLGTFSHVVIRRGLPQPTTDPIWEDQVSALAVARQPSIDIHSDDVKYLKSTTIQTHTLLLFLKLQHSEMVKWRHH